ncbi:cytochrome P450, partial [Rhizophagus diaphanus]
YNYEKYGDIYEIHLNGRFIILCRAKYIKKLLTPSTKNSHGLEELGVSGKGILINNNFKSWKYNRQFFAQAILSPKFTNEAIDWTNKLFNELEAYFDTLSDGKSDYPSAIIDLRLDELLRRVTRQEIENTSLDKPLPNDMLTSVITANTPRDVNYTKTVGGEALDRPMTDSEIRGIIFDGFLGGSDTTANEISFIIYYIAHNSDVKKKMIEEINRIFQGDKIPIVKEVSRIFPVSNLFSRCIENSDEIAGYQWPAGTMFRINADPDKFNPDRWMVEGFEPNKHSLLMFGGRLRICPGKKLVMIELICLMALLYRKYEIDLVDMNSPLKTISSSVIVCTELLVEIKPRD